MDHQSFVNLLSIVTVVVGFLLGKYVFPRVPQDKIKEVSKGLSLLTDYAAKFVVWANEFRSAETGQRKMELVVEQLYQVAEKAGIDISEEELKAIAQKAYEESIRGIKESGDSGGSVEISDDSSIHSDPIPVPEPVVPEEPSAESED